jgi:hypothetical protein
MMTFGMKGGHARTLSDSLSSSAGRVDEFVDESGNPLLILGD